MRLFFALWPPPDTARALAGWARELKTGGGARVTREETIHLTLAFLGESDPLKASAAGRAVQGSAFDLPIEIAQYWPHNRILWAGPRETPPVLAALVDALRLELYKEAFILDRRPYAAHITLVRKAARPPSIPDLPSVTWPAREFLLVRSLLSGAGARYETVERFPLARQA